MDAQPVEHSLEIDEVIERHVRRLGLPVAAPVVADDVIALCGEFAHLLGPHAPIGDAGMEEHHRDAEAIGLAADQCAVKIDFEGGGHVRLRFAKFSPSTRRRRWPEGRSGGAVTASIGSGREQRWGEQCRN